TSARRARGPPHPPPGEVRRVFREGGFPRRKVGAPGGRAWGDAPLEPGPGRARLSPSRPEGSGPAAAPGPRSRRVGGKPGHAILPRDVYRQTARRLPKRSPDDKESRRCRDSLRRRRRGPRKLARADATRRRVALRAPVRAGRGRRPDRLPLRLSGRRRGRHRPGERGRPGLTSLPLTTRASGPAGAAALARAGGGLSHPPPQHSNTSNREIFSPCEPMAVSKKKDKSSLTECGQQSDPTQTPAARKAQKTGPFQRYCEPIRVRNRPAVSSPALWERECCSTHRSEP